MATASPATTYSESMAQSGMFQKVGRAGMSGERSCAETGQPAPLLRQVSVKKQTALTPSSKSQGRSGRALASINNKGTPKINKAPFLAAAAPGQGLLSVTVAQNRI